MTQLNPQTQIEAIRTRAAAKARERIVSQGINLQSDDAAAAMQAALDGAEDKAWSAARYKALEGLMKRGIPGVSIAGDEAEPDERGKPYTIDDELDSYSQLVADQFVKGMTPVTYDEWSAKKRTLPKAMAEGTAGGFLTALEGAVGTAWAGAVNTWEEYGWDGIKWRDEAPTVQERIAQLNKIELNRREGAEATRLMLSLKFSEMFGSGDVGDTVATGFEQYAEELAGPPGQPVLKSERYGAPGGEFGATFVEESENIGSALGSLPMSAPSMLAPNKAARAVAMLPFAFSGYADAKSARYELWKEQVRMAEMLGVSPPPLPSTGEFEAWGGTGMVFEVGSEFVGDTVQVGALKFFSGKRIGQMGASRIGQGLVELQKSMLRSRGALGALKKYGGGVAVGAVTEGLEEVVPHAGMEVQDVITQQINLWNDNPEYFNTDRDFFSENTWQSFKVGAYAGGLMSGGSSVASPSAFRERSAQRKARKEVAKGTEFVTETLVQAQEQDAAQRVGQAANPPEGKRAIAEERFRRNVPTTRSSAMAAHHVEQMDAGNRAAMFVDPADMDTTITPEVKERMVALGISTKPVGTVNGKNVFVATGTVDAVKAMVNTGNFSALTGSPVSNDGNQMMGAIVLRDSAGRIVDVMPYSDPAQMFSAAPSVGTMAQQNGLTMDVVNHETQQTYSGLMDALSRQQDADAVQLGITRRTDKPAPAKQTNRGVKALRLDIDKAAKGSKNKKRAKASDPFTSPYLTADEIGDATNGDVTVTTVLTKVNEDQLSEGERNLSRTTTANATILDGKVMFVIKQKDGSVKKVEKPIRLDGAYLAQASPDGVFLVRDNGTAMNSRSAFVVALHEMRHRILSRSRSGAQYFAKLLQLDPVYAMRGGAQYMRAMYGGKLSTMSDAQVIAYFRGLHEAAYAVHQGTATAEQQQMVSESRVNAKGAPVGTPGSALADVRQFSEESVTTTANRAMGQTMTMAAEWDGIYRDAQERSFRSFSRWMANALVKNGFVGAEAQQALFELRQRLDGVREEEVKVHRKFSDTVSNAVRQDLEKAERRRQARAALAGSPQAGAAPASTPAAAAPPAASVPAPAPAPPPASPGGGGAPAPTVAPSMRMPEPTGGTTIGGDDEKLQAAMAAVQAAQAAPPEQRAAMLADAVGMLTQIVPALTQTTAQLAPGSRGSRPQLQPPSTRQIPAAMRDVVPAPAAEPAGAVEAAPPDLEAAAIRQRSVQGAMAIMRGERPTAPVQPGTVARIERARTLMQDADEEVRGSLRERPGRREANDDVRSARNEFMSAAGIEPEQRIEDTYAEVDPDFAYRLADWFESAKVNYDDPEMLSAYRQFGKETLDQYEFLRERGFEMVPWAGKGQPYADSADMIEDLRENKRLFYYKTNNAAEVNSFGSNPEAYQEALRRNPLLEDTGIEVLDSEGNPYRQTYNDLFRAVHDIMGHGAEGFQFGPRGEENAYRSHAVMYSPMARQAMATETRTQNSWVNFGPNRRNSDGTVWGQDDPRYAPWMERLKNGEGYADQKPVLTPPEFLGLYEAPQQARASLRPISLAEMSPTMRVWSRGAVAVDDTGSLLALTHGTKKPFESFTPSTRGAYGPGIYLATETDEANRFAGESEGSQVVPVVTNIKNPLVVDAGRGEQFVAKALDTLGRNFNDFALDKDNSIDTALNQALRAAGYDGVHVKAPRGYDIMDRSRGDYWVAWEPNQVKGYFNENPTADQRIMYSAAEQPAKKARAPKVVTPEQEEANRAKKAKAAQDRAAARVAMKNAEEARRTISGATKISISAEPTAQPFVSENIIVSRIRKEPGFSQEMAYRRSNERIRALIATDSFAVQLNELISRIAPNITNKVGLRNAISEVLGNYAGRTEEAMRIEIPGLTHEQSVDVGHLLGSLLLQEAVITTSPATPKTDVAEQGLAVMLFSQDTKPMEDSALRSLLGDAGSMLNGATTHESNRGVWSVWSDYEGNPVSREEFVKRATDVAKRHGMLVDTTTIRSTYTKIGDRDVLGAVQTNLRGTTGSGVGQPVVGEFNSWVQPAASIAEVLRDEGFDIDVRGWTKQVGGANGKALGDALLAELAKRERQRRHGLDPRLLTTFDGSMQGIVAEPKVPASTTSANAESSFREVDALLARHPAPFESEDAYKRFLADLFGERTIPIVPVHLLNRVKDNFAGMRKDMSLREDGGRLTHSMINDAIHGMEMAQRLRALYASGAVQPKHTVALAMWGFLSKGVSPYIQESLFLDIVNFKSKKGVTYGDFVDIAVNGNWNKKTDTARWVSFINEMFNSLAYAKTDENNRPTTDDKGNSIVVIGTPGSSAKHNANAFGRNFLANIGKRVTIGDKTTTGLMHFHGALANPNTTGKQVRRTFASIGESLGIDNKVVSFGCLVAGKTDVSVYDRVRVGDHYNRDGKYPNAYDGFTIGYRVFAYGEPKADFEIPLNLKPASATPQGYKTAYEDALKKAEKTAKRNFKSIKEEKVAELAPLVQRFEALPTTDDARRDFIARLLKTGYLDPKDESYIDVVPVKAGGLANLFNGARGLALYEAVERAIDPNAVFSEIVKKRPDLKKHANHGAEHWLNWTGASAQDASHGTLDGMIDMVSKRSETIVGVNAKEGRYDTYAYGAQYGYVVEGDETVPQYLYTANGVKYKFTPKQFTDFITKVTKFDWASVNWNKAAGKKPKFLVTKDSITGDDRTAPWFDDAMFGGKAQAQIATIAESTGVRASMRDMSDIDAVMSFTDALHKSFTDDPAINAVTGVDPNNPLSMEFARQNIAATDHEQAFGLYQRMVARAFPRPSVPRYTRYFATNNTLNGLTTNDLWFHAGGRQWTVPNYDISPNQFGLHIGTFDQASTFFERALEEQRRLVRNIGLAQDAGARARNEAVYKAHQPVMFPLYARASKHIEIPDQVSWEPELIINAMMRMELIDPGQRDDMMMEMYREIIAEHGIPQGTAFSSLNIDNMVDAAKNWSWKNDKGVLDIVKIDDHIRMSANRWLKEYFRDQGIESVVYQNWIEGKDLSQFSREEKWGRIETDAQREHRIAWDKRTSLAMKWLLSNSKASEKEKYAKEKEILGSAPSAIVWNTGQVKSASVDDVGFRIIDPDIRASIRLESPAIVKLNPMVFEDGSETRMSMREGLPGISDRATLEFIDKFDPLRRYGEIAERALGGNLPDIANPYLGARTLVGRLGSMQQNANRVYADMLRDMAENNISLADMDEFLTAQHAINGGNAYIAGINPRFPDGGTGMFTADAQQVIARAQAAGRYGDMNRIAEEWRELLRAGLAQRRDAGLVTQETYNILTNRYTHYVPLRGAPARPFDELFEDYDSGEVFGRGMSTQGRGMPQRLGRQSQAEGVTSQVGFIHEDTMRRVARNEIGQRFLRLVLAVNDPGMATVITPNPTTNALVNVPAAPGRPARREVRAIYDANWMNDPRNFGVYVNAPVEINGHQFEPGDLVVIRLNNPLLATAMNAPNVQLNALERGLRHANNAWRFVTTGMGNPTFAPVNLVRDIGAGTINNAAAHGLRDTGQMLRRYPRSFMRVFMDAWRDPTNPTGSYRDFVEAGGDQLYWRPNDLDTKNTDFDALAERVQRRDPNDRSLARALLGWYPAFFTAAETATRVAQYEQRRYAGASREQAALAARDITVDFAKGGRRKAGLNTYYMFLNASLQGSVNVARAIRRAAAFAPALVTFGAVTAMLGRAMSGEDDETEESLWDALPDWEKAANIVLFDPFGSGKHIKIPLPYGYSTFFSAGVRMVDAAFGKKTAGDAVAGIVTDALNSFNPFGGSGIKSGVGNVLAAFTPTMARPIAELGLNQNFMGRPIYPSAIGRQEKADAYSYFSGTPEFYTDTARILNDSTGGDMFEPGIIHMSPNTMQYLVGYYLSGAGRTVDRLAKMAYSAEPIDMSDIPMVRSFVGDARSDTRALSERFNAIASRTLPDVNRMEALRDPRVDADIRSGIAERGVSEENIAIGRAVQQADKEIRGINKALRTANPEQRQRLIEARERAMKRVIRTNNRLTSD